MLNIISSLLNLIDQHVIWLYVACFVMILFYARSYARARQERENTIFTIEKEVAAHKEERAMSGIGFLLGIAVVITAIKFYLVPTLDLAAVAGPTPTLTLTLQLPSKTPVLPTATSSPVPTVPTATPRPTPIPQSTLTAPATAATSQVTVVPRSVCADPNTRITSPGMNAVVSGSLAIIGTANHARFQFYKVEYGMGENPVSWHVIHDIHRTPVINGFLEELDTRMLPNGVYWLQLTVVDQSGNFPPPCRVRIVIRN